MRATKQFFVVAYDTPSTKRRRRIIKVIESYGKRINYSVYEVMLTPAQHLRVIEALTKIVIKGKDCIAIYRLCLDCFSKIQYLPSKNDGPDIVSII